MGVTGLMRPFLHPLGIFVLLAGGIAAVVVEDRAGWSDRGLWVVIWTGAGYLALVAVQFLPTFVLAQPGQRKRADTPSRVVSEAIGGAALETASTAAGSGRDELVAQMQEALRRLNNPAALGDCALAHTLPRTLTTFGEPRTETRFEGTSLSRARALRLVLVAGIEELRTSAGQGVAEAESLRYTILHEEYVLGRPNQQIMMRHNISESTFHRYRREAARLLGQELARREKALASNPIPESVTATSEQDI